jgi:type I restriction enzyme, S subunit
VAEVFDGPHATPTKTQNGPIFLGIGSLNRGRLDLSSTEHLSEEEFVKWTRRVTPKTGDVVFSYETRLGEAAIIPAGLRCCLGRRMGLVRTNLSELDPHFFLYQYLSPKFQEFLASRTIHGSTVDRIALKEFPDFEIDLPPLPVQKKVAKAMLEIDAKIEVNRRSNKTLEAMAQAIFKSWFVDFDPVKAKIAAKAESRDPLRAAMTAISGKPDAELDTLPPDQFSPLAATAALFPEEMEDSELGEIPKGWQVCPLPECVDINPARVLKKGAIAPYLDMANVPTHAARVDNVVPRAFGSGSKFINGDTLLARITPCLENGKTAYVDFLADGEVGWGSTEFIVLRPKDGLPLPFAYFLCRHPEFRAFAISQMAGTSGRQRVPNDCFGAYKVVEPSALVADAFGKQTTQFMKQIKSLDEESKTLAGLRDALLPRLLSGELQVQNTESEVAA